MNVIDTLTDLFILRGPPAYIRSDNGPEFTAQAVRDWLEPLGPRQPILNQLALGRTAIVKASMAGSEMNFCMEKHSTIYMILNNHRAMETALQH